MRSEEVIRKEKESAKETAEELDDNKPLDALITMAVYRTLKWVEGEGKESLDDELLKIKEDDGD